MKKAKVILIALFFIANLFAAYDLRFGDGKIVEFVENNVMAAKSAATGDGAWKLVCGHVTHTCRFNNDKYCEVVVTVVNGPYCP